ncbi:MAG: alpha/beta hydrolase fold domain-containing protein [Chloroflexota bacterium]|nr:alpha/beta hydrolase fold domain-containing protein [Chloroflexota bacterium]
MAAEVVEQKEDQKGLRPRRWTGRLLVAVSFGVALLLLAISALIPLTVPTIELMVLRIGAAELSIWLMLLSAFGLSLSLAALRIQRKGPRLVSVAAVVCSLASFGLASIPLTQLRGAVTRADGAMRDGLGDSYMLRLWPGAAPMRSDPFSLGDYFTGIKEPQPGVRTTRDMPYRIVGGHTLLLDRYDPPAKGAKDPHPGLLVIHGGSWRNGDKGEYADASRYFAARGYVVYDIQYRLSAEARFPAQLEDAECALGYMRTHASEVGLDPESVIVTGRSAGAHLALLAAYRAGIAPAPTGCGAMSGIKGVVALYPPTDLVDDYLHPAEPDLIHSRQVLEDFLGGSPDAVPNQYRSATPQQWLNRPLPPTLLLHGESDQIVLPRNSTGLGSRLREMGDKVVTILIPWGGHGYDAVFSGLSSQLSLYYWDRFMGYALGVSKVGP